MLEYENLRAALHTATTSRQAEKALRLAVALGLFWEVRSELTEGRGWPRPAAESTPAGLVATRQALALTMNSLAEAAIEQHVYPGARALAAASLELHRQLGDKIGMARSLTILALAGLQQGEAAEALGFAQQALSVARERRLRQAIPPLLDQLACCAVQLEQPVKAARLLGAATALASQETPLPLASCPSSENPLPQLRERMGQAAFEVAWDAGRGLPFDAAIEEALTVKVAAPQEGRRSARDKLVDLTPREREVAALVTQGMTNREIADALVISEGTANLHVKHILSKRGFRTRAQIAAWMASERQAAGSPQPTG